MDILKKIKKIFFTATAIYLTDDFIDVVKSRLTLRGIRISSLDRLPLNPNAENNLQQEKHEKIERALDGIFKDDDEKPYRIAVNIPDSHFILRRFTMANLPAGELEQASAFEAQKYIPCPLDGLAYNLKSYMTAGGLREIIFAASETRNIESVANLFKRREIIPAVIEPVPFLLARMIQIKKDLKPAGAYIAIHYEPPGKVIICDISHGYPHFFKEIGVDVNGLPALGEMFYPTLREVWQSIGYDVSRGIDYLKKETAKTVERIFISGFAHSADEQTISEEIGVAIERPRISCFPGIKAEDDRYIPALMLLYDTANKPFLNMSPKEITRSDVWGLKSVVFKMFLGFLAIIALHLVFHGINSGKFKKIEKLAAQYRSYGQINPMSPKSEVADYKNRVAEQLDFINEMLTTRRTLTEKLIELNKIMPAEAWIDELQFANKAGDSSGASMIIEGQMIGSPGQEGSSPNKIFENMKNDKVIMEGFDDAELSSVEKKELYKREISQFTIVLKKSGSSALSKPMGPTRHGQPKRPIRR